VAGVESERPRPEGAQYTNISRLCDHSRAPGI